MPQTMDEMRAELKARCSALASVGDRQADLTLRVLEDLTHRTKERDDYLEQRNNSYDEVQKLLGELKAARNFPEPNPEVANLRLAMGQAMEILGRAGGGSVNRIPSLDEEIAQYDKTAKEYFAKIAHRLTDLANSCRAKARTLPLPTPRPDEPAPGRTVTPLGQKYADDLLLHFREYIEEFREKGTRIEFLEHTLRVLTRSKVAPPTPPDWTPGESPYPKPGVAAAADPNVGKDALQRALELNGGTTHTYTGPSPGVPANPGAWTAPEITAAAATSALVSKAPPDTEYERLRDRCADWMRAVRKRSVQEGWGIPGCKIRPAALYVTEPLYSDLLALHAAQNDRMGTDLKRAEGDGPMLMRGVPVLLQPAAPPEVTVDRVRAEVEGSPAVAAAATTHPAGWYEKTDKMGDAAGNKGGD